MTAIKVARKKWFLTGLLFFLVLILGILLLYLQFINHYQALPGRLLQSALNQEKTVPFLDIRIVEEGPGYSLKFNGSINSGGVLYGTLAGYELELYRFGPTSLYIRDLKDSSWKNAVELKLDGLQQFLVTPFELLEAGVPFFTEARFVAQPAGEKRIIQFNIPATLQDKPILFQPAGPPENQEYICQVFLLEDTDTVHKMQIIWLDDETGADMIKRTYYLENRIPHELQREMQVDYDQEDRYTKTSQNRSKNLQAGSDQIILDAQK